MTIRCATAVTIWLLPLFSRAA